MPSKAATNAQMRGERYCEVIVSSSLTKYTVYNTWGLNHCPPNQWQKITEAQIKQATGATFVHLNGPRYWVIDGFQKTNLLNNEVKDFGGISMRAAGALRVGFMDLLHAKTPYRTHVVERHSTWIYQAQKPVYELIDPKGNVFVMQSYSTQAVAQTEQSLSTLGKRLTLPSGWQFKTGLLKQTATLPTLNDTATVIQDNFSNTYQLATHDFLK